MNQKNTAIGHDISAGRSKEFWPGTAGGELETLWNTHLKTPQVSNRQTSP